MDWLLSKILEQVESVVSQAAESGIRLVVGVNEDVDKLSSTFRTIRAVLADAETRQLKEEAVKIWLDKLQNVAYDMEDVLDEWSTSILRSQIPIDDLSSSSSVLSSKVCSLIQLPSNISIPRLFQRRDIAVKIKELNERLQEISREKDDFAFLVDSTRNKNDVEMERPKTTYFVDASEICGRDQDKKTLISILLTENHTEEWRIPIISIVGMGGIGKTALAQIVYSHCDLSAYFQKKIWVCVSDPFDEMRIAKAILEALTGSASSLNELNSVLEKIHESIMDKRYLLILDDVWNEDEGKWQSLKNCLNCGSRGSKILVTTRKENVATIMGGTELLHLGKLSEEECWSLFSQVAFSGRNDKERESLEDIGKEIAHKCQGLPLAAKTLGGLLRFKKSRQQWQRILDSHMWKLDEAEKGLFSPLLLSYYDLPSPLRHCFSYCAIFPKDYVIEKDLLIKLWMAQSFLGEGNDMEIVGEEYFHNLATRSFFQEFEKDADDDSIIIGCKMHDIVHDFAKLLRKTECCVVASNNIEERRADCCHKNVRHLTLFQDNEDVGIPDSMCNVKKIRTLLLVGSMSFGTSPLEASLATLFDQLSCLRTLDLSDHETIKELPQELGKLIHLRYLRLEGNSALSELPNALCDLCNLQTLNIRYCAIRKLPCGMGKLINLRHLQNAGTYNLTFLPKGMQRLTSLQTLEEFSAVKKGGHIEIEVSFSLVDLGKLSHLQGSLNIKGLGNLEEVGEAMEAQLSTKAGLRELTFNFYGERDSRIEDEAFLLQALQPPQYLQKLEILFCRSPVFPFPNWMTTLTSLKNIELGECDNWKSLPSMGKLPFLESLKISGMKKVTKVGEELVRVETCSSVNHNIAFPSLKTLEFEDMEEWEEWEYDEKVLRSKGGDNSSSSNITIMPKLQHLSLLDCPRLKRLPCYLLQSRTLQQLEIINSPLLFRRFNKPTGEDWPSISHIPTVQFRVHQMLGENRRTFNHSSARRCLSNSSSYC